MVRYTKLQKEIFSGSYMELANFAFASLIFAQFISKHFDPVLTLSGIGFYAFFHVLSYLITSSRD